MQMRHVGHTVLCTSQRYQIKKTHSVDETVSNARHSNMSMHVCVCVKEKRIYVGCCKQTCSKHTNTDLFHFMILCSFFLLRLSPCRAALVHACESMITEEDQWNLRSPGEAAGPPASEVRVGVDAVD